jgi:putative endonuclease
MGIKHHPTKTAAQIVGAAAESRACWRLRLYGWRICARNWIGGGGELDIVASRWRTLLIVEVRQRTTLAAAMASIDEEKIARTKSAAQSLIRQHSLERYCLRFDAMGWDEQGCLRWTENILQPNG